MGIVIGAGGDAGVPQTLLLVAVVLVSAKCCGLLAKKAGLPTVLGELVAGMLLGQAGRAGLFGLPDLAGDRYLGFLAEMGVVLLLFEVGVENTVSRVLSVGVPALRVAVLGVAAPFLLGWGATTLLVPDASSVLAVFVGATLCATSVGVTARILRDFGRGDTAEGRTVLGAAVLDDVLGLVVLAVVVRLASGTDEGIAGSAAAAAGEAALFLAGGIGAGVLLTKPLYAVAARLGMSGMLLSLSLAHCFLFAWGAHAAGLAPIVGAFAAGLVLEPAHSRLFQEEGEKHSLEDLLHPVSSFLVPVFFVHVGAQVELEAFADLSVLGLGLALTLAAVLGKLACALGAVRGTDGWAVGLGMVPRGEVGLVFVAAGAGLVVDGVPLVTPGVRAAVVFMVAATTLLGPILLGARLRRTAVPAVPE